MGKEKENRTFYITHSGELLIWLLVILVIVAISTVFNTKNKALDNDYNIYMPDVDGLIVGSPVRMMGIEVGHVSQIEPTGNEVFVKFLITDKDIVIPQGTLATVEFSGMAGSKSLELYLPDKTMYIDKNTPILYVEPPKRLHDALGLLNDMYDKITSIIYSSTSFGDKMNFINTTTNSNANIEEFLKYTNNLIDNSNKKINSFNKKIPPKYLNKEKE